jgi:UDP-N-acetyl-D-glucosamine dehydrogenase
LINNNEVVAVVGLGYVGLPVALESAKAGFNTIGIDIDYSKVNSLLDGISYIDDISDFTISQVVQDYSLDLSNDFSKLTTATIVILCVPTPLNDSRLPDLSQLESAIKAIAKYLNKGTMLILESTVAPSTTRLVLVPLIEKYTNLGIDNFDVVFSPERTDPKNLKWNINNTPKLVSGLTTKSLRRASNFYANFVEQVVECESLEVAETAKLLENTFRLVNISFINELSIFCERSGIRINDVIQAASTKPYGFMPFYPSIGIGGHCIPVDPLYLANKAREIGAPTRFIDLADQINQEMPGYFVERAEEKIGGLKGKKILVIGVSYKPNVADVRETPVKALILGLKNKGAEVSWHDDLVKEWNGEKSVALRPDFDLAILATPHNYLDLTKLGDLQIINTRGSI